MKYKILYILLFVFWLVIFGYLYYAGHTGVATTSIILLGLTIALANEH